MPQKQTILWTALPNGVKSGGAVLQLSVFVSPRLQTDQGLPRPQLSQFPDFQGWAAKVQGLQFSVQFGSGAPVAATRVGPAPDPSLWAALFKPTTYTQPYQPPDYSTHLIHSQPIGNLDSFIKSQYLNIGTSSPNALPAHSVLSAQLAPISLYQAPAAGGPATPSGRSQTRTVHPVKNAAQTVALPTELQSVVATLQPAVQPSANRSLLGLTRNSSVPLSPACLSAFQSIYQQLQQNRAVRDTGIDSPNADFLRSRLFYLPSMVPIAPLQPPDLDFHQIISTLGNYPQLMRALGLVIDLEVPVPSSVLNTTVKVLPTWAPDSPPSSFSTDFSAKTACTLDVAHGQFYATPQAGSKIADGLLDLSDATSFPVSNVDVSGSALKLTNLADRLSAPLTASAAVSGSTLRPLALRSNALPISTAANADGVASSASPGGSAALPALRTSGVSLAQTDRATWLANVFSKATQNNQAVSSNTPDQVTYYADDLTRGYRIDIWDSQSQSWHSLCRRNGTYNFFEANQTRQYNDEGWVQLGVTQPIADGSGGTQPPSDLYLQESMFTWNGWSLSAPRPGKTIAPDGTPQALDDPTIAQSRATSDFKMVASFTPPSGSLPRLRFGNSYRVRARVVDLAGNGLAPDAPNPTDFSKTTAPAPYTRFEPVTAPLVVMTKAIDGAKSPGESLGRLVLRSNYNATAQNYAPIYGNFVSDPTYTPFALRLVAPPKTSEAMAERHSMFDSPSGPMLSDPATYQMIATKADGAFMIDPATRLPIQPNLSLPYLPDPICRGSAQTLTNTITNTGAKCPGVSFYPGSATWPNAIPFFLKLEEGTGSASAQWDEPSRTLTIQLPKAQVATLDLSSLLGSGDQGNQFLALMGVWNWIKEASPANLAQLQQTAAAGLHWMLTPSRELVLVHAVQQPLIAPQFHALTAQRQQAATYAYIADDEPMPIDGPSTIKVDFEAAWQEWLDDVNDPNGPKVLSGSTHVYEWKVGVQDTALEIIAAVAQVDALNPAITPPAKLPKAKATGKHVVVAPVPAAKVVAPQAAVTSGPQAETLALKPGTILALDARVAMPSLPPPPKFGYSFRHDFGDTKYRKVNYTAIACTRFAEYFPIKDPTQLTRSSSFALDVPNSVRPPVPKVLYVVPTFGWDKKAGLSWEKGGAMVGNIRLPNLKGVATTSTRSGGGLRIYLDRPWYASGDGELLGVVVWPSPAGLRTTGVLAAQQPASRLSSKAASRTVAMAKVPAPGSVGAAAPDPLAALVTQWGIDPIWKTNPLPGDLPTLANFLNPQMTGTDLTLEEPSALKEPSSGAYNVAVAGYAPQYDKDRGLWYCDISIDSGSSYFPFVRLALVRFQPISVNDVHLSHVVMADFAQLVPDRSATIIWDPKNSKHIDLAVSGTSYGGATSGNGPSVMEITVESKPVGADPDLGWISVPDAIFNATGEPSASGTLWRVQIRLDHYKVPKQQELRLVIREYETFLADAQTPQLAKLAVASPSTPTRRLVYADVLSIPPIS